MQSTLALTVRFCQLIQNLTSIAKDFSVTLEDWQGENGEDEDLELPSNPLSR